MSNIFNLSEEYLNILNLIEEAEGEMTPELEKAFEVTKENLETKVENYCRLITSVEGNNATIDNEIERLQELKKVNENKVKRLKEIIKDVVLKFGYNGKTNKKLDLPLFKLYTKTSKSLKLKEDFELQEIPNKYLIYSLEAKNLSNEMLVKLHKVLNANQLANNFVEDSKINNALVKEKLESLDTQLDLLDEKGNKDKEDTFNEISKFAYLDKKVSVVIK